MLDLPSFLFGAAAGVAAITWLFVAIDSAEEVD